MVNVESKVFNALQENTYIVWDDTKEAVVIDPGCYSKQEQNSLIEFIESNQLSLKYILNTHCHADHVLGNSFLKHKYGIPLLVPEQELETLQSVKAYAFMYGFANYQEALPDQLMKIGQVIEFGTTKFRILFVPGHAPGHVAFYDDKSRSCWSGDVLFYRSIGRTDLPGGNYDTLIKSIQTQLFTLPDATVIYPGHGPATTIGNEKQYNPFLS